MKVEEAAIMNHKISAKAVKSNEIQAVNERRRGELLVAAHLSKAGRTDCQERRGILGCMAQIPQLEKQEANIWVSI